jgi:uncharacterized membrane protein
MSQKVVKTALTAILAIGISAQAVAATTPSPHDKMLKGMEKCYGIVKMGMNDCGSKSNNACAGSSKTDNEKSAWIFLPKGTCSKIVGGSTSEPTA